jgi:hypothetical protein
MESPSCLIYVCRRTVAIHAIELHNGPERTLSNRFHVDRVVQLDGAWIALAFSTCREFRMAILKSTNVRGEMEHPIGGLLIGMTFRTSAVASRFNVHPSSMLCVTCGTSELECLCFVVNRPIVTGEAGTIRCRCRERASLSGMARLAAFLKHSMRRA